MPLMDAQPRARERTVSVKKVAGGLLNNHACQSILSSLIRRDLPRIEEQIKAKTVITYPKAEEKLAIASESLHSCVKCLFEAGFLRREITKRVLSCPSCGGISLSPSPICPSCGSENLTHGDVLEHITCGHVGFESDFLTERGGYLCPKCRKILKQIGVDYRRLGPTYICQKCGKKFSTPKTVTSCNECQRRFPSENASSRDLYAYYINEERIDELAPKLFDVAPIADFLRERGYVVDQPCIIVGLSGAEHRFDLFGVKTEGKNRRTLVLRVMMASTQVEVREIAALYAEVLDSPVLRRGLNRPNHVIAICVPNFSPGSKRQAEAHNIVCIAASSVEEALARLNGSDWERREMKYPPLLL